MPFISQFVELTLENEQLRSYFGEPLVRMLYLFAVPPMLTCSSEMFNCKKDLTEYFNFLAYLLTNIEEKYVNDLALRALWCLVDKHPLPGKCCVPLALRHEAISESIVAETVAGLMKISSEEDYLFLLKFALLLSKVSEASGTKYFVT